MRSIISRLLALSSVVAVLAAPHEKQWTKKSGLDIHIEWPGSGGAPSTGEQPAAGRWPLSSILSTTRRWPFSSPDEDCTEPTPSPTHELRKKSYLDIEERAAATGTCDLQNALNYMDLSAVNPPLPSPAGLTLFQVALGRGTQNYTCDLSNATATPVAIGALATLYNFSCVAAQQPALLKRLPHIAINQPIPTVNNTRPKILDHMLSGHHYFLDSKTPFFNLDTAAHQYGMGAVNKTNAADAPAGSTPGQHGKQGFGAVQWLLLDQNPVAEDQWKAVYRLNTAGGNPPTTCTGQPAAFEIPYAAEYWLFT